MSKLWGLNLNCFGESKIFLYDSKELLLEQLHILFLEICDSVINNPEELVFRYSKSYSEEYGSKFAHWSIKDKLGYFEFEPDDIEESIDDILNQDLVIFRLLPQVKEMYAEAINSRYVEFFSDVNFEKIDSCVFENVFLYQNYFLNSLQKIRDELEEKLRFGDLFIPEKTDLPINDLFPSKTLFKSICKKKDIKQIRMCVSYTIKEASGEINEAISI